MINVYQGGVHAARFLAGCSSEASPACVHLSTSTSNTSLTRTLLGLPVLGLVLHRAVSGYRWFYRIGRQGRQLQ